MKMENNKPIDILLWCPNCFEQHVDEANPDVCENCGQAVADHWQGEGAKSIGCHDLKVWTNPPHKSHRCNFCNHVWRPSDTPTNGVLKLTSKGSRDGFARPRAFATKKDFDDAVEYARPSPWVPILPRMFAKTIVDMDSGCWNWQGAIKSRTSKHNRYGVVRIGSRTNGSRRTEGAHRISYQAFRGEIPTGLQVCHKCDNPLCWNPAQPEDDPYNPDAVPLEGIETMEDGNEKNEA